MTLASLTKTLKTLWQRDRDPSLDALRWHLHLRALLLAALMGVALTALRWFSEHRLDALPWVPLAALSAWAWLRKHPAHHRSMARLTTVFFLAIGLLDLQRPGQTIPWALFAMVTVPVYGTLLDGSVSGFIATAVLVGMWAWEGAHAADTSILLLIIFNGLSSMAFYFTSLAYTWIFGALLQRQQLSQLATQQAGEASRRLASTLSDDVTVSVGRLRAAMAQGLPDRRSLKDLQSLLANTRQALPQDLPSAPILPDQLLREQRRSAHRAYLLLGLIISVTAAIATWAMGMETWWIAALLSAACALLYFGGERLPIPWMWRFRAFIAACLGAVSLDITLSGHDTAATSVAFLPLIIFYAGMLDSIPAASLTFLGGLALLLAEGLLTAQNLWPYYPSSLILIAFSSFTMVGIGWAVAPSLRERMATLSAEEEQLRASLHSYRKVVSTLFHDLANPLAVLQTLANLPPALLQPEDQDRALRMVERLEAVTQAARQQTQAPGAALQQSLIALDGDLHDLFQERLDARRLTLRVAGPTGFSLKVDPRLRDSLLGQLLSNAVRYAPEGGLILLSAEPHEGGLRLSLRDSGPGFPPKTLKALARGAAPQPQPDARGEVGNGFGLLLASATARDLGGRLRLSNASGGGAQAELWLPG